MPQALDLTRSYGHFVRMKTILASLALMVSAAAHAQAVRVDAVQYPAWLERGGRAVPLAQGTVLQPQDKLVTGGNARVRLKLAEGSAVRLGENAQFTIERVEDRGVFRAALSVIAGAFRFTTDAALRSKPRDVGIKVKNVTVGIRGTDLWGKSTDARDLVCLLEGSISVGAEGFPAVTLDRPNDFYQKPRDGQPQVLQADPKQVQEWSVETAIEGESQADASAGRWRMVAATTPTRDDALKIVRTLRSAGYPAEVGSLEGKIVIQVPGLDSEAHARAVMANVRGLPGVELPKVARMP